MEEILNKLEEINNTLTGVLVFAAFSCIIIVFIFIVVFFDYYDKTKLQERKKMKDEIRREIKEETNNQR